MSFVCKKKFCMAAAAASAALLPCMPALCQTVGGASPDAIEQPVGRLGDAQVFAGVRIWANTFDVAVPTRVITVDPNTSTQSIRDVETRLSTSKITPMPFVGLRYGKFVASASYFARTSYDSKGLLNGDLHREELDLNAGYYVLPQLAVSVGYKMGKLDKLSAAVSGGSRIDAILVGASGSLPLEASSRLSLYGNFAYGLGRSKFGFTLPSGENKLNVSYTIGEVGLAYRLFSAPSSALKSLSLSLGYRTQFVTFKDAPFGTYSGIASATPSSIERKDSRSTTDGFVLGLVGVF
jgi:hypothetical protein